MEVKSTVGAGDSSLAGYIVSFVKDNPTEECLRMAAACGTACAMQDGSVVATKETAIPLLEQVKVRKLG